MPRTALHECPGTCGERIGRSRWICHRCWLALPTHMRRAVNGAHPKSTARAAAKHDAVEWLHNTTPGQGAA